MQSIGIFGGTFDPVHIGHLGAVREVDQQCQLSQIRWVLSARPPHKDRVSASIAQRFKMLDIAVHDHAHYRPDDIEIKRSELSYTYTTVKAFRSAYPDASINLIIGADSIGNIRTWYRYLDILSFVNLVVMNRPGHQLDIPHELITEGSGESEGLVKASAINQHLAGRVACIDTTEYSISSTEIRSLLSDLDTRLKPEVQALLDPNVYDYIIDNQLYLPNP